MAFFDKVGATLSNFGNDVSSKTKAMMEVSNLSGQLKNCEDSLKAYYEEIGRAYYEKYKNDPNAEFADKMSHVKEAEEAIDHLESAIRHAKGTRMCQNCKAEVASDTVFCPVCGTKVDPNASCNVPVDVSVGEKCPTCGASVKIGAAFCTSCGTKMN